MRIPIFCFLISVFFFTNATAQPELTIVRGNKNYPPYEIYQPGEPVTGFHIDLVTAVAERLGVTVTFNSVPWRRALYMIESGQADAITYMGKTPEREQFAIFEPGNKISHSINAFFVRQGEAEKIGYQGDFRKLNGYMIGKVLGYSYGTNFDNFPWLSITDNAKDEKRQLDMLLAHHIDIGIANKDRVAYFASQAGIRQKIEFLAPTFSPIPQYLAFSKASPNHEWATPFALAMLEFIQSEEYQLLIKKYQIE
ncbi:transporter substrate-binding domain-containing protein [Vibrio sp. JC009]|uniref:substrate-binding periplasmic protein n=1 Tax=Vibrio sp. JC009 TaxID=2912314 RepID=UPI0023B151B2|nr:transporter substrate-binding domain-containing protein [Vibrio sp. JC009]WED23630.1 transporter substrate-binding domain-containing protein [Vibrio sp. JC009]